MGVWYDIESYPQFFQEGTCSTASYGLDEVVNVFNTQVVNQALDSIIGHAVPNPSASGEAKLTVTFPIAGTDSKLHSNHNLQLLKLETGNTFQNVIDFTTLSTFII